MRILLVFAFLYLVGPLACQAQANEEFDRATYVNALKQERKQKDTEMRNDEHSPIPDEEKSAFEGLHYYSVDLDYHVEASFVRFDQATHFLMKTTTDRLPEYSVYGKLTFKLGDVEYTLNVYQNIELIKKPGFEHYLFLPFNDLTNGNETYGGGRFLDMTDTGGQTLIIDFNKAYNPYCAYNHKYSCPIPPESNNLKVKIKAGEKKYH